MMVPLVARSCSNDAREAFERTEQIDVDDALENRWAKASRQAPENYRSSAHQHVHGTQFRRNFFAKAFSRAPNSRTSAATAQTLAPSAESSPAAAFSFSWVRPQIATLAPKAAKFFATSEIDTRCRHRSRKRSCR